MPPSPERTPRERETLIFSNAEGAQEFTERVEGRMQQEGQPGVDNRKEVVAEEVLKEFEQEGEGVDVIRHPWDHTPQEHEEAQELVNVAFEDDLRTALRKAKSSDHYPRNLDLLHDVLTTEMYALLVQEKLNQQSNVPWVLSVSIVVTGALLLILVLVFLWVAG